MIIKSINKILIPLFLLNISVKTHAQVIAGSTPAGTSIINPNLNLSVTGYYHDTVSFLDIDCDNINDIRVRLSACFPAVDCPNEVEFLNINNSYSLCSDVVPNWNPVFYNYGDTLCSGNYVWVTAPNYQLGCLGSLSCYPFPDMVTDKYLAYYKFSTQQVGWIKISFDLTQLTITLAVSELVVLCDITSISHNTNEDTFYLSPNPTVDGKLNISWDKEISSVNIYNSLGKCIKSMAGNVKEFTLPEPGGLFFIRIYDLDGNSHLEKIYRD